MVLFVTMLALSVAFAVVHWNAVKPPTGSIVVLIYDYLLFLLLTPRPDFPPNATDDSVQALYLLGAAVRLVLPSVFIGALTFKLFIHPDIFVFRRTLSLYSDEGKWRISARLYNSSPLTAYQVAPTIYLRQRRKGKPVRNIPIDCLLPHDAYPVMGQHTPFTITIELKSGDVECDESGKAVALRKLQGHELTTRCELIYLLDGIIPKIDNDFTEPHVFNLTTAVDFGRHTLIKVRKGKSPKYWIGWDSFEAREEGPEPVDPAG